LSIIDLRTQAKRFVLVLGEMKERMNLTDWLTLNLMMIQNRVEPKKERERFGGRNTHKIIVVFINGS
jgi:hypothetical protein